MTDRKCRRCGIPLTRENARTFNGRWVGACRQCESIMRVERQRRRNERPEQPAPVIAFLNVFAAQRAIERHRTIFRSLEESRDQ